MSRLRIANCQILVAILVACALLLSPISAVAQTPTPPPEYSKLVTALIKSMSVNQRVGQLFVINFPGTDTSSSSDIADLITNYRVGGVQLLASNQNVVNAVDTPRQVTDLTNRLQLLAAYTETIPIGSATVTPTEEVPVRSLAGGAEFIPLFIAMSQEGDGAPYSEVTQGLTPVPSELAVGATWKTDNAQVVGQIVGRELATIGVNVLLGPDLDVLDTPKPNTPGDPGTRVFGGDPYWVGKFGSAYIDGVHTGGSNRVAVIATHFPGLGSSDRSVDDEIPTVQKSLEQLKQIELAPFFAVTQLENGVPVTSTTDGLLVSHIRYRGFQGNIRASTRPVSLDPQAYQALMSLAEIAPWRDAGGITFSDELGVRGVRRFYDPLDETFNARRVASEAFIAGNDVLVLGNFGLNNSWPEELANIKDTIQFFREKYVSDPTFAVRVDAALARILTLKLKLYNGKFTQQAVLNDPDLAAQIRPNAEAIAAIAKDSITLLSPGARDLPNFLPAASSKDEAIVFITDDRQMKECLRCVPYAAIPRTALQDIALELYGPKTTGLLNQANIASFTFSDLADYTARAVPAPSATQTPTVTVVGESSSPAVTPTATTEPPRVQTAIDQANLIVIAMLDLNPSAKSTQIFRDFLAQRADALRDKRVVVFAFGAPYYLDATEISKLTAYFGVYSRTPPFLEAAIRVLFGEVPPNGDSPVSVSALNYSLLVQTAPDPSQVIPLSAGDPLTVTQATPSSLGLRIGDKLKLRAGPVYDRNGHIVPDGTPIQFVLAYPAEHVEQQQPSVSAQDGIAETTVVIERQGTLEIRAFSDPAMTSYVIRLDIGDKAASIETIKPTALPTDTPEPTPTATQKPTPEATATLVPPATNPSPPPVTRSSIEGFVVTSVVLIMIGLVTLVTLSGSRRFNVAIRWRLVLWSWSAGWIAYVLYATGAPGTKLIASVLGWAGSALLAGGIAIIVLVVVLVFMVFVREHPEGSVSSH